MTNYCLTNKGDMTNALIKKCEGKIICTATRYVVFESHYDHDYVQDVCSPEIVSIAHHK